MKKYRIDLPAKAVENLELEKNTPLVLMVDNKTLTIRPSRTVEMLPQIMMRWYLIPAVLAAVIFFCLSWANHHWVISLTGNWSIGFASLYLGTFSGVVAFATAFIRQKRHHSGPAMELHWRNLPTLLIAFGTILAISIMIGFWLAEKMFAGASFDIYTSTLFVFLFVAAITYGMLNLAMTISEAVITNSMMIMIIGGMLFSMLTNSNRDWWHYNFSYLGTQQNATYWRFNITLIFSALLMATLVDYLFFNLQKKYPDRGVKVLRILLYAEAACLGGIGCFPNDPQYHVLHDRISMWLVYIMILIIGLLRWLMPGLSRQFLKISYIIGGIMALDWLVFKATSYLSLTAFELLEFGLSFSWLLLLFQNLEYLARIGDQIFLVRIEKNDDHH
ncbi:ABC transporter permease [Limosilactobacillus mucosae]|uniref:ABC transporter permease n=1 Tax=Limosilactobacillus mucosae TaxID=97478 RepID=UPI000FFC2D31|nr:ABC transporter permease [Limosilactobacillus mucosae]RXA58776.1 ABC transporter permease [Limosilactobacillus mucosae]